MVTPNERTKTTRLNVYIIPFPQERDQIMVRSNGSPE